MTKVLTSVAAVEAVAIAVVFTLVALGAAPKLILWVAIVVISNTLGGLLTSVARDGLARKADTRLAECTAIVLKAIDRSRDEMKAELDHARADMEVRIETSRRQLVEATAKDNQALSGEFVDLGNRVTEQMQYVLQVFGHYAHEEDEIAKHLTQVAAMNVPRTDHTLLHLPRR